MLKYDTIDHLDQTYVMQTYRRLPALMVQGAGCHLWDNRGNEYLDLLAGVAVCGLGHCHPAVVAAITRQAQQLMHVSNLLLTAPQAQLAEKLCRLSGMERVFFSNCGASAVETALKIAKKTGASRGATEIVTLEGSFHGRTLGALAATGQAKFQAPFLPLTPGFRHVPFDDLEALRAAVGEHTAAILIEPILGESGVWPVSEAYLRLARELADRFGALLIFDEIQTGIGRTGTWFAFEHTGVRPDVLCLAKGLGGGVPIGACLARCEAATSLQPGEHGSTFGGNPLACAASLAVLDTIEHEALLEQVQAVGQVFKEGVAALGGPVIEVRGRGLMLGVELKEPTAREAVQKAFARGLIVNATGETTLRLVPPLILTEEQARRAIQILGEVLGVREAVPARAKPSPRGAALRDVLSIDDLSADQIEEILSLAAFEKQRRKLAPSMIAPVENRSVAMVFEKPSLRTRFSFETGIRELGGHAIYLTKSDIGLGQRESIRDVAQNLSRWSVAIVARLYWHRQILELAEHADVPVVNALTEWEHPCQALADLMTIRESFGEERVKITYVGDGNNVARSLAKLAQKLGYPFAICGPQNFRLEDLKGIEQTDDLREGLREASAVYTDVWISMGDEHEQEHRLKVFAEYQVSSDVMKLADRKAIFLHCLPAHRGYEVTDEVIDSNQSKVVDQAENRLHAQKALMQKVLGLA